MITDKELSYLSACSYSGNFSDNFGVVEFKSSETGTTGYLLLDSETKDAVIVFRGTERNNKDILTDLQFGKTKHKGLYVHYGFMKAYQSISLELNLYTQSIPKDFRLYSTGHSLGGALAAIHAIFGLTKPDKLVTFGQPRIGRLGLIGKLRGIHYVRYVNHADIVPRVPKLNYYHGGDLIYISHNNEKVCNPSGWFMFKDRLSSFADRFTDHKISNYIKKV